MQSCPATRMMVLITMVTRVVHMRPIVNKCRKNYQTETLQYPMIRY